MARFCTETDHYIFLVLIFNEGAYTATMNPHDLVSTPSDYMYEQT